MDFAVLAFHFFNLFQMFRATRKVIFDGFVLEREASSEPKVVRSV